MLSPSFHARSSSALISHKSWLAKVVLSESFSACGRGLKNSLAHRDPCASLRAGSERGATHPSESRTRHLPYTTITGLESWSSGGRAHSTVICNIPSVHTLTPTYPHASPTSRIPAAISLFVFVTNPRNTAATDITGSEQPAGGVETRAKYLTNNLAA